MEKHNLDIYRYRLVKIWTDNYNNADNVIAPLYPETVLEKTLLFLSLNPSLPPDKKENPKMGCEPGTYPAVYSHPHFNRFFEIQHEVNLEWTFLDLLYNRESNQYKIKDLHRSNKTFIDQQTILTLDIIKNIKPTMVVVSNKFAADILHQCEYFHYRPDENNVWRFEGIPFIMRESTFMGGWRYLNLERKKYFKDRLCAEILRINAIVKS